MADLLRQTLADWFRHRCMSKGAALAFYALFSLAPVLVLVIALAGLVFGPEAAAGEIVRQFEALIGRNGAEAVQAAIRGAHDPTRGGVASVIAVAALIIGSTTAFAELKESLDEIWGGAHERESSILASVRVRLLSFGLVLVLAFLLLISLVVNAVLAMLAGYWSAGAGGSLAAMLTSHVVTFFVITALFAAIFKLLPPVSLAWGDVLLGALLTAALFEVGKYFIGMYLGNAAVTSTFGAVGSLGVLALWVYYSTQIFFLGAEFTRLYARGRGTLRDNATHSTGGASHANRRAAAHA